MMGIKAIVYQIVDSIRSALEEPKPKIQLLSVPSTQVDTELAALGLRKMPGTLFDYGSPYYFLSSEDWAEAFDYIYFRFNMPSYIASRTDCDDFAILLKGLVSSFFGLNCFALVLGGTPSGCHAWNIFRTEDRWVQFEPQNGNIFELNEKGYEPRYILV